MIPADYTSSFEHLLIRETIFNTAAEHTNLIELLIEICKALINFRGPSIKDLFHWKRTFLFFPYTTGCSNSASKYSIKRPKPITVFSDCNVEFSSFYT